MLTRLFRSQDLSPAFKKNLMQKLCLRDLISWTWDCHVNSEAFFLDDSVRSWRGVTLVDDQHCLFGSPSGPKASGNVVGEASVS